MPMFEFLLAGGLAAGGQSPPPGIGGSQTATDKGVYSLFNPTPRPFMRTMYTDRPDQTEFPYTADAGRSKAKLDFVNAMIDRTRTGGSDVHTEEIHESIRTGI
jgi:hypothetical protein